MVCYCDAMVLCGRLVSKRTCTSTRKSTKIYEGVRMTRVPNACLPELADRRTRITSGVGWDVLTTYRHTSTDAMAGAEARALRFPISAGASMA